MGKLKNHCHICGVKLGSGGNARGVMLNLALVISTSIWKFERKYIVKLNNERDARRVMLNLHRSSQLRYGSLRKVTVRNLMLNLVAT